MEVRGEEKVTCFLCKGKGEIAKVRAAFTTFSTGAAVAKTENQVLGRGGGEELGGDCRLGGGGSHVRGKLGGGDCGLGGGGSVDREELVGGDCGLGGGGVDWGVEWWSGVVTNSSGE